MPELVLVTVLAGRWAVALMNCHQHGEGLRLIQRELGVEAHPALARTPRRAVLDAEADEGTPLVVIVDAEQIDPFLGFLRRHLGRFLGATAGRWTMLHLGREELVNKCHGIRVAASAEPRLSSDGCIPRNDANRIGSPG